MPTAIEQLTQLQAEMNKANDSYVSLGNMRRLCFFEVGGLIHIDYYGPHSRDYDEEEEDAGIPDTQLPLFETLAQPEVASRVASLILDAPDEGANGTKSWDFSWLLDQNVTLPELKTLIIKPTPLEDHNRAVVGFGQSENGQLAKLFAKTPALSVLTTPSAPGAEFFEVEHESLYSMRVNAGYDPQDFILNLSRKSSPLVYILDWGEVQNDLYGADEAATPYEHFEALFSSPGCPHDIILRNPKLSDEQITKLVGIRREKCRALGGSADLRIFYTYYGRDASAQGEFWIETEPSGLWRNSLGNEGNR